MPTRIIVVPSPCCRGLPLSRRGNARILRTDARQRNRVPSPLVGEGQGEGTRAVARNDVAMSTARTLPLVDSSAPTGARPLTLTLSHKGRGDSVGPPCVVHGSFRELRETVQPDPRWSGRRGRRC